ncbi:MAG: hypothetical protein RLZZ436_2853 [Planctomycetota bacterium]
MVNHRNRPQHRWLRGYALDPGVSLSSSSWRFNELTYQVRWEELQRRSTAADAGSVPTGEYIEIIDVDPASGVVYEPVDLDDPALLVQDGLEPNVGNPQFHQQMVYAVIMTTIANFEKALGRPVMWSERFVADSSRRRKRKNQPPLKPEFVQRLRVYPHALRQGNAFYDPERKALLFGYFQSRPASRQLQLPGSIVFTCLSHDIVAHETAHAILDGVHRRYIDATHPDTLAFHEAFADLVALLQHFTFPEVLRGQIALTRGDLQQQNLLAQLALEFGQATGSYGSLRDALGEFDDHGHWHPRQPDPSDYETQLEPHDRGGLLVAAVFEAFVTVYQSRVERIRRIATGGSGILPAGAIHPDLVDELAAAAARTASEVLRICIRALDYCPPMDLTFGDYLRAIITADLDQVSIDDKGYRVAFVEAFRRRGISAEGVPSMAIEDLAYERHPLGPKDPAVEAIAGFLREFAGTVGYLTKRRDIFTETQKYIEDEDGKGGLHSLIEQAIAGGLSQKFRKLTGLMFPAGREKCEQQGIEYGYLAKELASYAVGNIALARRAAPNGRILNHVIVTLAQKRGVAFREHRGEWSIDRKNWFVPRDDGRNHLEHDDWIQFRGGCTLIFDLDDLSLLYAISKPLDDEQRMLRQFNYTSGRMGSAPAMYFGTGSMQSAIGPFAMMHSHVPAEGDRHGH